MSIPLLYSSTTIKTHINPSFTKTFPLNIPYKSKSNPNKIECTQSYPVSNRNKDHISKARKRTLNYNNINRRNILIGLGSTSLLGATIIQSPNMDLAFATPKNPTIFLANEILPRKLDSTIRAQVPRSQKSRSKKQKEEQEEVLNVNMELLQMDKYIKFDVFINEEDDNPPKMRVMNSEYAGSFVSLPQSSKKSNQKTSLTLGLTDLIQDLGVDDHDSVEVILVPRSGFGAVVITDVKIDYVSV